MLLKQGFYLVNRQDREIVSESFDTLDEALAARQASPHKHNLFVLFVPDNAAWGE